MHSANKSDDQMTDYLSLMNNSFLQEIKNGAMTDDVGFDTNDEKVQNTDGLRPEITEELEKRELSNNNHDLNHHITYNNANQKYSKRAESEINNNQFSNPFVNKHKPDTSPSFGSYFHLNEIMTKKSMDISTERKNISEHVYHQIVEAKEKISWAETEQRIAHQSFKDTQKKLQQAKDHLNEVIKLEQEHAKGR